MFCIKYKFLVYCIAIGPLAMAINDVATIPNDGACDASCI